MILIIAPLFTHKKPMTMKKVTLIAVLLLAAATTTAQTRAHKAIVPDPSEPVGQPTTRVYSLNGELRYEATDAPTLPENSVLLFVSEGVSYYMVDEVSSEEVATAR